MTVICRSCGAFSRITSSRRAGDTVRRRRECVKCGGRWSTLEVLELKTRLEKIRGFSVPPDRKAEYLKRMRKKGAKAADVGRAMGLIEDTET